MQHPPWPKLAPSPTHPTTCQAWGHGARVCGVFLGPTHPLSPLVGGANPLGWGAGLQYQLPRRTTFWGMGVTPPPPSPSLPPTPPPRLEVSFWFQGLGGSGGGGEGCQGKDPWWAALQLAQQLGHCWTPCWLQPRHGLEQGLSWGPTPMSFGHLVTKLGHGQAGRGNMMMWRFTLTPTHAASLSYTCSPPPLTCVLPRRQPCQQDKSSGRAKGWCSRHSNPHGTP